MSEEPAVAAAERLKKLIYGGHIIAIQVEPVDEDVLPDDHRTRALASAIVLTFSDGRKLEIFPTCDHRKPTDFGLIEAEARPRF